jgi:hypothetical protein
MKLVHARLVRVAKARQLLSRNLEHALVNIHKSDHIHLKLKLEDHVFVHLEDIIYGEGPMAYLLTQCF